MNRARKTGKGLPRRVYIKFGAYYFVPAVPMTDPKDGKTKAWIRLSSFADGPAPMLLALGAMLQDKTVEKGSMPHACAQYKAKRLGGYSDETKATYSQYLDTIATAFEEFHVTQVTTFDWSEFLDKNFSDKHNTAKKYTALARRLFKFIISSLGLRQDNPIDQIDMADYDTEVRTVLPKHAQVIAIRTAGMHSKPRKDTGKTLPTPSGPMFACLVDIAYLLWQRAIDVRMLKEAQIDGEIGGYIRFKPRKTKKSSEKSVDILITPAIWKVIERARAIKKDYLIHGQPLITPYLFPTRKGTPYGKSGLFSMWDRARDRLGIDRDSPPDERIQFKDLRALGATDAAKAGKKMEDIQDRLVHTSQKTSEIYIKEAVPDKSEINMPLPWPTK